MYLIIRDVSSSRSCPGDGTSKPSDQRDSGILRRRNRKRHPRQLHPHGSRTGGRFTLIRGTPIGGGAVPESQLMLGSIVLTSSARTTFRFSGCYHPGSGHSQSRESAQVTRIGADHLACKPILAIVPPCAAECRLVCVTGVLIFANARTCVAFVCAPRGAV